MKIETTYGVLEFSEGIKLEGFMSVNALTAFSVAKDALKECKLVYARAAANSLKKASDAALTRGSQRAVFNKKDAAFEIVTTLSHKQRAVEGDIMHSEAVERFLYRQKERTAQAEAQTIAFRNACKAAWAAEQEERKAAEIEKAKADAAAQKIASQLAAEMA
jgi:hypothetical protein